VSEATEDAAEPDPAESDAEVADGLFWRVVPEYGTYVLAVLSMLLGLLAAPDLAAEGLQAYDDPSSGVNVLYFGGAVAAGTIGILLVQRLGYGKTVFRMLFLGIFGYEAAIMASVFLPGGTVVAGAVGLGLFLALWFHPEWYVVDVAGVLLCAAIVAIIGISLVPGLVLAILVGMAVYDAYSVYVSGHMQSLVDGSLDLAIPMAFVLPRSPSFSLTAVGGIGDLTDEEGGASLLGYGDAVIPGIMAVSAGQFLDAPALLAAAPFLNAPALGALIGGIVGTAALHVLLSKLEGAQPALIVLNPTVVGGYLLGALAAGVPLVTALGLEGVV
jgi:presenilin-like A22 family membrane protease